MNEDYSIFQQVGIMFEGFGELVRMSSGMGVAGIRMLFDGKVNPPGIIMLSLIIGVIVFMYWAIKYR